jgi:hypothetical protein
MIRFIFRLIGLVLLAGGFAALVIDGTRSIAGNRLLWTPFEQTAQWLLPGKLPLLQAIVERDVHPLLWNPVLITIFRLPASLVLGVLGVVLLLISRKRSRSIGFTSRP